MAYESAEVTVFERTALVSEAEIDAFRRDGVVHLRGVLTNREVDLLRTAIDDQFRNRQQSPTGYDFQSLAKQFWSTREKPKAAAASRFNLDVMTNAINADPKARALFDGDPDPDGSFFYDVAGWRHYSEIREAAFDSDLPEVAATLMASSYVNFWEDTTFVKTPGATIRTPFHQDYTYFQISGRKCCITWIPLDSTDGANGAMEYVIGSHRWSVEFQPSVFIAQTPIPGSTGERLPDIEALRQDYEIRTIAAEPGDVIVHDVMTVHGSSGNKSANRRRRGVSFRYCGDDIRYCSKPGAVPQPWIRNKPAEGEPLYSRFHPRVWPRPFPEAKLSRLYDSALLSAG